MVTEIELFKPPNLNPLYFCYWSWMQREVYEERKIYKTNCSLALCVLLPAPRNARINTDDKDAIFAHESQSAWKLTVGFSNIYCKLQQIFNLKIKLKYN